jgi:L-lactate dehydrogenase complex protein LldF
MKPTSRSFVSNVKAAVVDDRLHAAVINATDRFVTGRRRAADAFPNFEGLRDRAKAIKDHSLAHLDHYLEAFEAKVKSNGGSVHWARDGAEANAVIAGICRDVGAAKITKSKSMVSEEIALNDALEAEDMEVTETDLGEYIIQLAGEHPSHIIAPAIHRNRQDVEALFREKHTDLGDQPLDTVSALVAESRRVLRQRFLAADVGITGANFLIAETGSFVVVTNEGNADLTANLPRVHIVIASIEKVLPTLEDASTMLRILARSCTGQETSVYTTLFTGPKRDGDPDGPGELHVVLLDNGRGKMLGTDFQPMLRCIKCSACLNHCPVYNAIGGHAYGWVYTGPMGAVLSPLLIGLDEAHHLPNASSLCGACGEVCPVKIPLPELLRKHREREYEEKITPPRWRAGLKAWGWLASHPGLYRMATAIGMRVLSLMAGRRGRLRKVPLAGGWTAGRDLPAPEGRTFMAQLKDKGGSR